MFTTPEDWTLVAREMFSNAPDARAQFADFDRLVAQELVDTHSWRDLEGFYAEAALSTLSQAEFEKLQTRTTADFEAGVLTTLRKAFARASQDARIKAIYCEYLFDGDIRCNISAHLYSTFSRKGSHSPSQFRGLKDRIDGPPVLDVFAVTHNAELNALDSKVRDAYINARLMAAWVRAIQSLSPSLPVGFAQHDFPVITFMPRMN
jgi:hypothetical protein